MEIQKLHHVVYRCKDAKETAKFYTELLDLDFAMAVSESNVPSSGEACPYIHVFFEMADGSSVAFFELPEEPEMQMDPNTPEWVQHLALEIGDMDELNAAKERLENAGVEVVGPTDHAFCQSIYFFDPNGHRLELTVRTETPEMMQRLRDTAEPMLEEWDQTKTVSDKAAWVHENANAGR